MAATSDTRRPATQSILSALAVAVVAAAFGAAFLLRGPDAASPALPLMAERPVLLPDGRALYVQKYEVSVAE